MCILYVVQPCELLYGDTCVQPAQVLLPWRQTFKVVTCSTRAASYFKVPNLSIKVFSSFTLMSLFLLCPSILSSVPGSEEVQMLLTVIEANEVGAQPFHSHF